MRRGALALVVVIVLGTVLVGTLLDRPSETEPPRPTFHFEEWRVLEDREFSNASLSVRGNLSIAAGAHLRLREVEVRFVGPAGSRGVLRVEPGGSLRFDGGSIAPEGESAYAIEVPTGGRLELRNVALARPGLGAGQGVGITSAADDLLVEGCTFTDYRSALAVRGGRGIALLGNRFLQGRGGPDDYVVAVERASGVRVEDNEFVPNADTGALLVRSPDNRILRNRISLPRDGTADKPVYLHYDYATGNRADNTTFEDNVLEGASLHVNGASDVIVRGNRINGTGDSRPFGIQAIVQIGTAPGLWSRNLTIEDNVIRNYTRYGIRLEQNISHSVVRGNDIRAPDGRRFGEAYGIYLIRAVHNVTVSGNFVDAHVEGEDVVTLGISLEARVLDCRVENNTILDANQHAINVQGYDAFGSPAPYHTGPSLRNVIANNTLALTRPILQTRNLVTAIVSWLWANGTFIENNAIVDYALANEASWYNGAAFFTSSSLQTFRGNRVENVRWGVVFRTFSPKHENNATGSFDRSFNEVYGNSMTGVARSAVVGDESDGMGPIRNLVLVAALPEGGGWPAVHYEAPGPVRSLTWESTGEAFLAGMRVTSSDGSGTRLVEAALPFRGPLARWSVSGDLDPRGRDGLEIEHVPTWSYRIATLGPTRHAVSVREAGVYEVSLSASGAPTNASIPTGGDLLAFGANMTGDLRVGARVKASVPTPVGAVLVDTEPPGRSFRIDGRALSEGHSTVWGLSSLHRIDVEGIQGVSGEERWRWESWSDGGPSSHDVGPALDWRPESRDGLPAASHPYGGGPYAEHMLLSPTRHMDVLTEPVDIVRWRWTFPPSVDLDFAVYADADCDGSYGVGDEVSALAAATGFVPESLRLHNPAPGCYWTHAASVSGGPATFDQVREEGVAVSLTRYTARFARQYRVSIETVPPATVRIDGAWMETPVALWFDGGTSHELHVALRVAGRDFVGWSDGASDAVRLVRVDGPGTFVARYEEPLPVAAWAAASAAGVAGLLVAWRVLRTRGGSGARRPPGRVQPPPAEPGAHGETREPPDDPRGGEQVEGPGKRQADDEDGKGREARRNP